MNRNVLIALAVATVVLIGGVYAFQRFVPGFGRDSASSSGIVIVTRDMLDEMASSQDRSMSHELEVAFQRRDQGGNQAAQQAAEDATQAVPAAAGAGASDANRQADARLLRKLFSDQLEAMLSDILTQSGRYRVANPTALQPVLSRLSATTATANEQEEGRSAEPANQGAAARIWAAGTQAAQRDLDPTQNVGLADAVREMGVGYLLTVFLEQPVRTWTADSRRFRIEADPVYVYRLYRLDSSGGYALTTGVARMPQPVVVELPLDLLAAEVGGVQAHFERAMQEMGVELQRAIAEQVAAHVIDVMYPAHIASADPMRITRGASHGVTEGDVFNIFYRDTKNAVRDGGNVIDVPETMVGTARVTAVQRNSATVEPAAGVTINASELRQYVVRRVGEGAEGGGQGGGAGYAAGGGVGLGVADMAQREAGVVSASVAVGQLSLRSDIDNLRVAAGGFESALSGRLARDQRITVLSRQGLEQLRREQTASGARRSYVTSGGNIARAGFLVLGDVTVSTDRQATTVRVAGAEPRETSVTHYLVANATLRIEASDSRLLGTYDVSARTRIASPSAATSAEASRALSEAFAAAAAEQILPHLFPIEVASVEGAVILSRGADVGLRVGDRLTMYRLGSPVIDRHTNRQISAGARRRVGELRIDDVQDTIATASVVGDYAPSIGDIGEVGAAAAAQPARPRQAPAQQQQTQEPNVPW